MTHRINKNFLRYFAFCLFSIIAINSAIAASFQFGGVRYDVASITSAAGTTTLTKASKQIQQVTGTTTQTVQLPAANTLQAGFWYEVVNNSTGTVTVKDGGTSTIKTLAGGKSSRFTLLDASTAAGSWAISTTGTVDLASSDVTGITPVANGGTGTSAQFTANSVVYAGASGVYTESNSSFNWNPATGALKTPRLTLAPAATNQGVINFSNLAGTRAFELGVLGNNLYLDWGGITYLYMVDGWTGFNSGTAPVWSADFAQSATSTNIVTDVVRNSGSFNLPVIMSRNSSSTANNYSGFIFAGASTASTAMDAGIFAVHEAHTNGAESARMEFYNRNAGTLARSMAIAKDKTVTMDKYGTGIAHFSSAGVISSSAVDLASADVTGALPIANGGTGQTAKAAAFDALSPMTASGDIIYGGTSGTGTRLAKGTDGHVLTLASGVPTWAAASGGGAASSDYRCYDDSGNSNGGVGSTNTTVAYFENLTGSSGSSITETNNNSTSGLELTIATAGNYCASWNTNYSNANIDFAVTVNSTQLTTNPGSGSFNGLKTMTGATGRAVSANVHYGVSACQYLAVNDVVRPQSSTSPGNGSDTSFQSFCLRRMN